MNFFNKSKFIASKLVESIEIKPTIAFSIPLFIIDAVTYFEVISVTATIEKVDGRNITALPTVVTMTGTAFTYTATGTIASLDWDGIVPLNLKIIADGQTIIVPLVTKG